VCQGLAPGRSFSFIAANAGPMAGWTLTLSYCSGRPRTTLQSYLAHPLAVVDSDHHPCTVVEAVVLLRSHHEHAVRPDDVARLERIAQREAEFLRPRLGLLERLRHRLGEEQVAVVGWPPNVVRESLPYLASYGTM